MNPLIIIPARAGSKGLPGKNTKLLNGLPLLAYTINYAKKIVAVDSICVSSNDKDVIAIAEESGLNIPFVRPEHLADDKASASVVIRHALEYYKNSGKTFDCVVYLQPTSPFRIIEHYKEALDLFSRSGSQMVVAVTRSKANPYFNLFEENTDGYLSISKQTDSQISSRQEAGVVYSYTGSLYIIDVNAIQGMDINQFSKVTKYEISSEFAVDIDTQSDFSYAEYLVKEGLITHD